MQTNPHFTKNIFKNVQKPIFIFALSISFSTALISCSSDDMEMPATSKKMNTESFMRRNDSIPKHDSIVKGEKDGDDTDPPFIIPVIPPKK